MTNKSATIKRQDQKTAYLYLSPILIGFCLFTLLPVVATFILSFTHFEFNASPHFTGLANYQDLAHSPIFWKVVGNTFYYVILYVPLGVIVSLCLALLLETKLRGKRLFGLSVFRTIYFLPVVTSMVAAAILWGWLYNSDVGLLNFLLSLCGIDGPKWLQDPHWALPAIAVMSVWKNAGYNMMIFLAGLSNIPEDYIEAARLDGASAARRFWGITLPLLTPVLFVVTVVTTIGAFQVFEQTYVLTQGGPSNSTLTLSFYIWQTAFAYFNLGSASAQSYVLFVIVLLVTLIQFRTRKRLSW